MTAKDLKADLQDLHIAAAKELDVGGGRKAIIIFVPYRQLKDFHKIQPRLVRELEKKFRYDLSFAFPNVYTIQWKTRRYCWSKNHFTS